MKWAEEKAAAGGNPQKYVDIAAAGKAKKVVEKEQADEENALGLGVSTSRNLWFL